MRGRNHLFTTGWLLMMSAAIFAAFVLCSRAKIRGSSDEALVGKAVSQIQISADWSQEWRDSRGTIALFRGRCQIVQGNTTYSAESMVIWARESSDAPVHVDELTAYLEGDVRIDDGTNVRTENSHWLNLDANRGVTLAVRGRVTERSGEDDPLFKRALQQRKGAKRTRLQPVQLTVATAAEPNAGWRPVSMQGPVGMRQIRVSPRSPSHPFSIHSQPSDDTNNEQVTVVTGGVEIFITGLPPVDGQDVGAIDLMADRAVIFTDQFSTNQTQAPDQKYQVYLEGNIVILQRDNVRGADNKVIASSAYFDARDHRALILGAELETYLPKLDATIRLRADRIRQNSERNFHAQNAWITTSQYGQPGYRLQSSDIFLEDRPASSLFGSRSDSEINPATGRPAPADQTWITAINSQFLIDQFPIFNIPRLSGPSDVLNNIPLQGISYGQDRVYGTQIRTRWDAFSLFGIQRPQNPDVKLSLDANYYSYRGPATGFNGTYSGTDDNGNTYRGAGWGSLIYDTGHDNLGYDRRSLTPSTTLRGAFDTDLRYELFQNNATLFGEISDISDRNVLESYQRLKFEQQKDLETKAQYNQRLGDNEVFTILGRTQLNNFENNTQWLPRGDLYFLGEPILSGLINYSSHSSAGYAVMNSAANPTDPMDAASFTPLPYMTNASGIVAQTRHELEAPFNLGPLKIAPFVLGEAAFWGDNGTAVNTTDLNFSGQPIGRLFGKVGLRASLAFERIFPGIQSDIFNLNGLAHKSMFDAELSITGTTQSLQNIAQWNEIDDNAQERFRMRLLIDTFGGTLPPQFDPRFYAVRTGTGATVTAPYGELVSNQQVLRLGWHQRLQTKVGPPEMQRIKDWMTLDLGVSIFPNANRDDFGSTIGLANSRFAWNVGDRTTVTASSNYDFFNQGMQLWSVGVTSQRSLRGSIGLNIFQVKGGPLDSQIASVSYSYVMSPKWVSTFADAYDFGQSRNAGQSFTITRVGEWLLFHLGGNVDVSKNNVGLMLSVEPRIGRSVLSSTNLSSLLGNPGGTPTKF